jgi:hypothetical protein
MIMNIAELPIFLGAVLILAGLILMYYPLMPPISRIVAGLNPLKVKTAGILMIGVGAFLLGLGVFIHSN